MEKGVSGFHCIFRFQGVEPLFLSFQYFPPVTFFSPCIRLSKLYSSRWTLVQERWSEARVERVLRWMRMDEATGRSKKVKEGCGGLEDQRWG